MRSLFYTFLIITFVIIAIYTNYCFFDSDDLDTAYTDMVMQGFSKLVLLDVLYRSFELLGVVVNEFGSFFLNDIKVTYIILLMTTLLTLLTMYGFVRLLCHCIDGFIKSYIVHSLCHRVLFSQTSHSILPFV